MRIALFSETFLPEVDGIAAALCRLLEHFARRGRARGSASRRAGRGRSSAGCTRWRTTLAPSSAACDDELLDPYAGLVAGAARWAA